MVDHVAAYAPHFENNHDGTASWYDASGNVIATFDSTNRRLTVPAGSTLLVAGSQVLNTAVDGAVVTLGTDGDIALVERATILNANTALTNVVVGTPVTPAVAANSLILANVTADGDILIVAQTGGNSHAILWNDASARITYLYDTVRLAPIGIFGLGAGATATIATGVLTATRSYMIMDAEGAGTTDQLDSITGPGTPADGDLLLLVSNATDTITVDDANINLAAATRAVAPGGSLLLRYDGGESQWTEVLFTAAADNV